MKVILFASQKGGSSKTTLCRCLAVAADQAGVGAVGMIDTDPQGTLTKWWKRRAAQTPNLLRLRSIRDDLAATLEAAREGGLAYVFMDTQGAITESLAAVIPYADTVIIPVRASPDDLEAVPETLRIIQPAAKPFRFCPHADQTERRNHQPGAACFVQLWRCRRRHYGRPHRLCQLRD